jgi:hypothetical protein
VPLFAVISAQQLAQFGRVSGDYERGPRARRHPDLMVMIVRRRLDAEGALEELECRVIGWAND